MYAQSGLQNTAAYQPEIPQRSPFQPKGHQSYQQHTAGATQGTSQSSLNMSDLKASLPTQAALDTGPADAAQLAYVQANMFPTYYGSNTLGNSYAWPYVPATTPVDVPRRPSWSSEDNNALNQAGAQEYYPHMPFYPVSAVQSQHYIAGPIQPMKCADNKSYEMVNLDELVARDPPIPRAVPALWTNQEELSLAKCLQNPEGITNVYIRGFMPDTTDTDLDHWASRFGEIESCKAIIEQDTGKCKGFGFVIYAQKSRNSRLKDLEDKASTNIYCTGVPIEWNESDLANHFRPYNAISTKICRDVPSGVSKEVGFARFESREIAERVIREYHSYHVDHDGVKLCLRFADTKAQKQLKQQSQERRNWRSREYSYSVEHTPSPTVMRLQGAAHHPSPNGSYQSPAAASHNFTPATSVSPPETAGTKIMPKVAANAWPMQGGLQSITNSASVRAQQISGRGYVDTTKHTSADAVPEVNEPKVKAEKSSPEKVESRSESVTRKENISSHI
ncbi:Sporulation-specific protein 5 [Cyphellophora attinorum]|uniref:Sporulation-specific protein 5 n=1 Tax=Cyphellophora attinorum TaxID=1664694 RepID=A0A0N1H1W0_9EURO|nr:Sporulation-specific protein 5 [Phialophora attinorum]KPI38464.1 Sporulation-specific protein 5 [Phialophora attinorum]